MFYTSLQNHGVFMWIYNRIHKKVEKLQYFSKDSSFTSKNYQTSENKRIIGKKPSLFIENCLFLTLIRLRVGLTETDLAFCFQVSVAIKNTCQMDIISLPRTFKRQMYCSIIQNVLRDIKMLLVILIAQKAFQKKQEQQSKMRLLVKFQASFFL